MSERAWYLACGPEDVAERAVLVGDPNRIELFVEHLDDVRTVGDNRGLRVVTGSTDGVPLTVCAFGMGAPVAVIVLEELAKLGVRTFLRVGTVMTLEPGALGELVVAAAALRGEKTSATYVPDGYPALPDLDLLFGTLVTLERLEKPYRIGLVASLDGFYSEMFAASPERDESVAARLRALADVGVIAIDMETSALLVVARWLGVRAGSLCLASVDGWTRVKLEGDERREGEARLVAATLAAISNHDGLLASAIADAARSPTTAREEV
jgi:uridine phosphorylase